MWRRTSNRLPQCMLTLKVLSNQSSRLVQVCLKASTQGSLQWEIPEKSVSGNGQRRTRVMEDQEEDTEAAEVEEVEEEEAEVEVEEAAEEAAEEGRAIRAGQTIPGNKAKLFSLQKGTAQNWACPCFSQSRLSEGGQSNSPHSPKGGICCKLSCSLSQHQPLSCCLPGVSQCR